MQTHTACFSLIGYLQLYEYKLILQSGSYKKTAMAAGSFSSRCCATVMHLLSFKVLFVEFFSCKFLGFHASDYEECHLVGCYAMWLL
jgi:hypothetical protein